MKISFAEKLEMSQVFSDEGRVIPVTKVKLFDDVKISALLSEEKHGYTAVQAGAKYTKKVSDKALPRISREVRVAKLDEDLAVGNPLTIEQFSVGDKLTIKGVSKGKGFQGVVKRHGFSGANATHGTKHNERTTGSIGSGFPQHVLKGRKMPGHMGTKSQTLKNIEVVLVDVENNILMLKGPMPGARGSLLVLQG